jgi:hypothetical protein
VDSLRTEDDTAQNHSRLSFVAYKVSSEPFELTPAEHSRSWMDLTPDRYAYRCLPMVIANQAGWFVTVGTTVRAKWNGGERKEDLQIEVDQAEQHLVAGSHFGTGIVTWHIPYLFRTPPGYNLLVRGPSNLPLDGASPLEGIVETDWAVATFTMNWKLTRPDHQVVFPRGYPVAMIVPQLRGDLERFDPEVSAIRHSPELEQAYRAWGDNREQFNKGLQGLEAAATEMQWQKHYFHGTSPSGAKAAQHQTKLNLKPFVQLE